MYFRFSLFAVLLTTLACGTRPPADTTAANAAAIEGAWTTQTTGPDGRPLTLTTIVMDGYLSETAYSVADRRFVRTWGGRYTVNRDTFTATIEFDSSDPAAVGKSRSLAFQLKGDRLHFPADNETWTRVDKGMDSPLAGAWLITGRQRNGEVQRSTPGERKTMKILSGDRFQWIAYHTGTGAFSGTGGGTYTAEDGKYSERIEFFSRDSSRVGAVLTFDYKIEDGEWHHSGLSSRGEPIYEIWTPRGRLE